MSKKKRSGANRSLRPLVRRYLLTLILFIPSLILLAVIADVLARTLASLFTWQSSPLYNALVHIHDIYPLLVVIAVIIGVVVISCIYITKPLRWLEETVDAAERLTKPDENAIILSEPLSDVEDKLNLARETALRSALIAREAEQRKNDLIVYLAHDLKTPLTSVIGYMTLLRDEPQLSAEMRARYTGIALDKAERLEELINEFFDITRFNLTQMTLEKETINLTRLIEQTVSEFEPLFAEKRLTCSPSLDPDVKLCCDADKIARVFDNLMRNAVNYSYPDTAVALSLWVSDGRIFVRISNRGKTIPPDKLARIFEQFFRLDPSRSGSTGGAGLGLAIAKEIVELHGGTLTADSADECIIFTVTLPA